MEKELFRILQELKININSIENMDYNKNIRDLTASECSMEVLYESVNSEFEKIQKEIKIYSILTLGIYYLIRKKDYKSLKICIESMLSEIEKNYSIVKQSKINYKFEKYLNDLKLNVYKINYNQIDNFIKLTNDMTLEEKEKYLSYTMN